MRLFSPDSSTDSSVTDFDDLVSSFSWDVPEFFNIASVVCDRHAGSGATALYYEHENGDSSEWTFLQVQHLANQLANWLVEQGVGKGDLVALILSQRIETAVSHVAAHKIGAVSLPLSVLFGTDALKYRLNDSGAKVVITDIAHADLLAGIRDDLPNLDHLLVCDGKGDDAQNFWSVLSTQSQEYETAATRSDDPALLLYTSGTTGPPKGALVAHRSMIGNLPGFELSLNFFPQKDDVFFTPADWAWTGGLFDGLLPCWFYGKPIVGYEYRKYNAEAILKIIEKYRVTTGFFPPTALKMMRSVTGISERFQLKLRAIMSAGEMVGDELLQWGARELDVVINEMYGQTEHNYMVGNCSAVMKPKPGSMGKAYPGHRVELMDPNGELLVDGLVGEFVAHKDDAVHFLGYWNKPEATNAKYTGPWFHTGDTGYRDDDGYLWFVGRTDDVITSAGYRIGPGEIEDCVLQHPAVLQAAAIGVPDPEGIRGDVVKVFVVLKDGHVGGDALAGEIQQAVRKNLAAYEYPRAIEFVASLPMTTTGKVRRLELREMESRRREND